MKKKKYYKLVFVALLFGALSLLASTLIHDFIYDGKDYFFVLLDAYLMILMIVLGIVGFSLIGIGLWELSK